MVDAEIIVRKTSASEVATMAGEEEAMMTTKTIAAIVRNPKPVVEHPKEVMVAMKTIVVIVGSPKPAVKHPKLQFLPEYHKTQETLQVVAMVVTETMVGMAVTAAMTIESAKTLQGHSAPYVIQGGMQITLSGYTL